METTTPLPWDSVEAQAIAVAHAKEKGGLLPALHALQGRFGSIPAEAVLLLAQAFNITRAEVHGVVTFYHDFHYERRASRHVLKLCRAEACQAVGGEALAEKMKKKLSLDWGETSADSAWALEQVFCLGLCACGPSAMIDSMPLGRADEKSLIDAMQEAET